MEAMHDTIGENGFVWYVGLVEDISTDPKMLGRCKVRAFHIHNTDKTQVSTDQLPWAHMSQGIVSAANKEIGVSPTGIQIGSMVWGFFMDGNHYQQPVVCGVIAGLPGGMNDVAKLARGTNTVKFAGSPGEPKDPYAAKYPNNKVLTTTAGHVVEVDDTPGAERIRIYHKSGSYDTYLPSGDKSDKVTGDKYITVDKDFNINVSGNVNLNVKGNVSANVGGTIVAKSGGSTTSKAPTQYITS